MLIFKKYSFNEKKNMLVRVSECDANSSNDLVQIMTLTCFDPRVFESQADGFTMSQKSTIRWR